MISLSRVLVLLSRTAMRMEGAMVDPVLLASAGPSCPNQKLFKVRQSSLMTWGMSASNTASNTLSKVVMELSPPN